MAKPILWYIDLKAECVIAEFFKDTDWLEMWYRRPTVPGSTGAQGVDVTVALVKNTPLSPVNFSAKIQFPVPFPVPTMLSLIWGIN